MRKLAGVCILAAGTIVGWLHWRQLRPEPFVVSGFIEADEIRAGSRVGGRVAEVFVSEGQRVRAGQPLFRLDPFDLRQMLAEAEAQRAAARAELERMQAGFRPGETEQARGRRHRAAAALTRLEAGPRPREVEIARERPNAARANLERAESDHARIMELARHNQAAKAEIDEAVRSLKASRAEATTALNSVNLLAIRLSTGRARAVGESIQVAAARNQQGDPVLPIEARTRLLYSPDLKSSIFFVPGLVGIILQLVLLFMTSSSIARERELGTLEQLFVTPVGRAGLLFGKLVPYLLISFGQLLIVLSLMVGVFGVPIHGSLSLLITLACLFMVTVLGMGLLISTIATTQIQATQLAFLMMFPSVLLSGFMFPRSEMPLLVYLVTFILPVAYFLEILRGVVLRGADALDLLPHILGLAVS